MSILSALNTGAGGLDANSTELSVIGDNIANANTVGFKASRAVFEDALAQTLVGNGPSQVGLGTRVSSVQRLTMQGALTTTNRATDLALEGSGYFIASGALNGRTGTYYTRAGQFTLDRDGYLTTLNGMRVQGYQADATGTVGATLGDLRVNGSTSPPLPSSNVALRANLSAEATPPAGGFNIANPSGTSNYSTSVVVYDSLGSAHQVDVYFERTAAGWNWHALTDGGGLTGGTAGTPVEIFGGTLTFDATGALSGSTQTTNNFNPLGATNPQAMTFNFGTAVPAGSGIDGVTQFSGASATSFISQDGYAAGDLSNVSVDSMGRLVGTFSNGQTRALGQVAVATFPAEENLERLGGNMFMAKPDAGDPTVGAPGAGGRGSIVAGALEQSNVDMGAEFVRMIAAQRSFQANAKTVTTADQLLQELMTLKR